MKLVKRNLEDSHLGEQLANEPDEYEERSAISKSNAADVEEKVVLADA